MHRTTEGITHRMLASTLRYLERDGLVTRTVYPTVPPRVQYALTGSGRSLHDILEHLVQWTQDNMDLMLQARVQYDANAESQDQVHLT
ncbi:DNA-binding HxlR family transcriptional regulator [Nocardia sp. GAS34]|uniref:winged helix-turn-helix transcriptional regulator n=1 Tax=unclassified Nocardia TaxID=2637762 RepID=UPI003D257A57